MSCGQTLQDHLSRPEHALAVYCSRTHLDDGTATKIETLLKNEIDWDYLFKFARRHSVLPLLYLQLKTLAPGSVPADELNRLKTFYQENLGRNLYLTGELCRILSTFSDAGVEAIPYKGPALAISAYGNLDSRRFVDLDIMVRKADVKRAKELLLARGYQCETDWTEAQQTLLMRTQHNMAMRREHGRLIVELHWEVAPDLFASSFQAEQLWERLEPMSLNNLTVKTLSGEDLLLSSCIHGSKHLWERLAWICDVAELLRTGRDLNWADLCRRANATATDRMMFLGLCLAHCLFNAPVPDDIRSQMFADKSVSGLARRVCEGLFRGPEPVLPPLRESLSFNMHLRSTWGSRFRYCLLIFRPTDRDLGAFSFPRSLSFVYYAMRPFRMLREERKRRLAAN